MAFPFAVVEFLLIVVRSDGSACATTLRMTLGKASPASDAQRNPARAGRYGLAGTSAC